MCVLALNAETGQPELCSETEDWVTREAVGNLL